MWFLMKVITLIVSSVMLQYAVKNVSIERYFIDNKSSDDSLKLIPLHVDEFGPDMDNPLLETPGTNQNLKTCVDEYGPDMDKPLLDTPGTNKMLNTCVDEYGPNMDKPLLDTPGKNEMLKTYVDEFRPDMDKPLLETPGSNQMLKTYVDEYGPDMGKPLLETAGTNKMLKTYVDKYGPDMDKPLLEIPEINKMLKTCVDEYGPEKEKALLEPSKTKKIFKPSVTDLGKEIGRDTLSNKLVYAKVCLTKKSIWFFKTIPFDLQKFSARRRQAFQDKALFQVTRINIDVFGFTPYQEEICELQLQKLNLNLLNSTMNELQVISTSNYKVFEVCELVKSENVAEVIWVLSKLSAKKSTFPKIYSSSSSALMVFLKPLRSASPGNDYKNLNRIVNELQIISHQEEQQLISIKTPTKERDETPTLKCSVHEVPALQHSTSPATFKTLKTCRKIDEFDVLHDSYSMLLPRQLKSMKICPKYPALNFHSISLVHATSLHTNKSENNSLNSVKKEDFESDQLKDATKYERYLAFKSVYEHSITGTFFEDFLLHWTSTDLHIEIMKERDYLLHEYARRHLKDILMKKAAWRRKTNVALRYIKLYTTLSNVIIKYYWRKLICILAYSKDSILSMLTSLPKFCFNIALECARLIYRFSKQGLKRSGFTIKELVYLLLVLGIICKLKKCHDDEMKKLENLYELEIAAIRLEACKAMDKSDKEMEEFRKGSEKLRVKSGKNMLAQITKLETMIEKLEANRLIPPPGPPPPMPPPPPPGLEFLPIMMPFAACPPPFLPPPPPPPPQFFNSMMSPAENAFVPSPLQNHQASQQQAVQHHTARPQHGGRLMN